MGYCLFEKCHSSPIYERINQSWQKELKHQGYDILVFDRTDYSNDQLALNCLQKLIDTHPIDYSFILGDPNLITYAWNQTTKTFSFEHFPGHLIFLHYDNLLFISTMLGDESLNNKKEGKQSVYCRKLLNAYQKIQHKALHFCLEKTNLWDLSQLGISSCYPIYHASDFTPSNEGETKQYDHDISFVGHVLPGLSEYFTYATSIPHSHLIARDVWTRIAQLDHQFNSSCQQYSTEYCKQVFKEYLPLDFVEVKAHYLRDIHVLSQLFRGEVIRRIDPRFQLSIIGGDPSYLRKGNRNAKIEKSSIRYYPATEDYLMTQDIYQKSKINFNITSLQFDYAVINRIIDVAFAGGFILTDFRPDLEELTSVAEQISYHSIDELNKKIEYYLTHEEERLAIAKQLHEDIATKCSYSQMFTYIMEKVKEKSVMNISPLKIDLGCGIHKQEGYIGVDIFPHPNVDIVTNLNGIFPFADNSVDEVKAYDVIEHLKSPLHTMNELWRICKHDGIVDIRVPSTDGRGAFQDPTHISFWNVHSFFYYCIEFPAYWQLCQSYGFKGAFHLLSLAEEDSGQNVIHVRAKLKAIKIISQNPPLPAHFSIRLKAKNYILFPDWQKPPQEIYEVLITVIRSTLNHPNHQQIQLLIDTSNYQSETSPDPQEMIADISLQLYLQEHLDLEKQGLEITFVSSLNPDDYAILISHLNAWILLPNNQNQSVVNLLESSLNSIGKLGLINL